MAKKRRTKLKPAKAKTKKRGLSPGLLAYMAKKKAAKAAKTRTKTTTSKILRPPATTTAVKRKTITRTSNPQSSRRSRTFY